MGLERQSARCPTNMACNGTCEKDFVQGTGTNVLNLPDETIYQRYVLKTRFAFRDTTKRNLSQTTHRRAVGFQRQGDLGFDGGIPPPTIRKDEKSKR